MMSETTSFPADSLAIPGARAFYRGKVRDVYTLHDGRLVMIASDRISAFDHILPRAIPDKGCVLNTIAAKFLEMTRPIVPNWLISVPDARAAIGLACAPFKVEMVIRGYLCGHALRQYNEGHRTLCGEPMPEGIQPYQAFPQPIITPTTKADVGHDMDISRAEILQQGIVSEAHYRLLEKYTRELFAAGTEYARARGLILADTKYEFGLLDGKIYLIDEVHTPDSSRYFHQEGFEQHVAEGTTPRQLSKEFVREWLMANGFRGREGEQIPEMTDEVVKIIRDRYLELFELVTGERWTGENRAESAEELLQKITAALKN